MSKKKPVTLTAKQLAARVKKFEKAKNAFLDEVLDMQVTMENEARRHDYEIIMPLLDEVIMIGQDIESAAINFLTTLECVEIQDEDEA